MDLKSVAGSAGRAAAARKAAGKSNFNAERTRYISRELLGWACYVGRVEGGDFKGRRVGVCEEEAAADRWLAGENVYFVQKADEHGILRVGGGWSDHDPEWERRVEEEDEARLERVNPVPFVPYEFCDGKHPWPRCFDPKCWGPPAPLEEPAGRRAVKCDGNHGGPRCADPECWNDMEGDDGDGYERGTWEAEPERPADDSDDRTAPSENAAVEHGNDGAGSDGESDGGGD